MHRTILLSLALIAGSLSIPQAAHACSCMQQSVAEGLQSADAVFEANVLSVGLDGPSPMALRRAQVEVSRVWKGQVATNVELGTASNSAMCGYNFTEGSTYLVYARQTEKGLRVGSCSRTTKVEHATDDFAHLGEPTLQPTANVQKNTEAPPPALQPKSSKCGCGRCTVAPMSNSVPASALVVLALIPLAVWVRRRT